MKKSLTISKSFRDLGEAGEPKLEENNVSFSMKALTNTPLESASICRYVVCPKRKSDDASISESSSNSCGKFSVNRHGLNRSSHGISSTNNGSTSSMSSMTPSMIDFSARRSMSDSVVSRCSDSTINYDNKNTLFMMINRSGSSTAKKIIAAINERCDQLDATLSTFSVQVHQPVSPPEKETFILARWAVDSYYRKVITSNDGIRAIIRAMQTFPYSRGLQECCCICLANVCYSDQQQQQHQVSSLSMLSASTSQIRNVNIISQNKVDNNLDSRSFHNVSKANKSDTNSCLCPASLRCIDECNGVRYVVTAMKNFPKSIAIQSAGCDALRNMHDLIVRQEKPCSKERLSELDESKNHRSKRIVDLEAKHDHNDLCEKYDDSLNISTSTCTSMTLDLLIPDINDGNNIVQHHCTTTSRTLKYDDLIHVLTNAYEIYLNTSQRNVAMTLLTEVMNQNK
jgi:hypothetical protein